MYAQRTISEVGFGPEGDRPLSLASRLGDDLAMLVEGIQQVVTKGRVGLNVLRFVTDVEPSADDK